MLKMSVKNLLNCWRYKKVTELVEKVITEKIAFEIQIVHDSDFTISEISPNWNTFKYSVV